MTFTIIKKGNNNFWHLFNNGAKEVNLSDFQAVLDSVAQTFIIQALNGANIPQTAVGILDIIVIDETDASLEETFANVEELRTRLVELGYTPYLGAVADNITGLIEAGTNVTITGDGTTGSPYVISSSGGGGGAVTSVNSDTGAVIVDLQSATDEGNVVEYGAETTFAKYQTSADVFAEIRSTDDGFLALDIQVSTGEKVSYQGEGIVNQRGGVNKTLNLPFIEGILAMGFQSKIANFTAENEVPYIANGTLTVTDPTPVANRGYIVHVIGGTSTIGGVGYTTGALVYRYYDGSSWISTNMNSAITIDATPTDGSSNAVSSNGVFDALALKSNKNEVETFIFSKSGGSYGSHTGTTAETVLLSVDISAGEFVVGDIINYVAFIEKPLINGTATIRVRAGVNGTTSDALIATSSAASNTDVSNYIERTRHQFLSGNILKVLRNNTAVFSDRTPTSRLDSVSLTFSSAWKLTFTIQLSNALDEATLTGYRIGKIKTI
jgi:hypothetical protein